MARELEYRAPTLQDEPRRGWRFCVLCHSAAGPDDVAELTMVVEDEDGRLVFVNPGAIRFVSGNDHEYARSWQCLTNASVLTPFESRRDV